MEKKHKYNLYRRHILINILLGRKFQPFEGGLVALVSNQLDCTVPETHALGNARVRYAAVK